MAFSSEAVANELLRLAERDGKPITPMKLQKLAYIAHGWHLGLLDTPLLDEQVEAWKYGPVIPSLYHEFKEFRMRPITGRASTFAMLPSGGFKIHEPTMSDEDPEAAKPSMDVVEAVYKSYKDYTAVQLSNATHRPETPWHDVYEVEWKGNPPQGTDIPTHKIRAHYKKLAGTSK